MLMFVASAIIVPHERPYIVAHEAKRNTCEYLFNIDVWRLINKTKPFEGLTIRNKLQFYVAPVTDNLTHC